MQSLLKKRVQARIIGFFASKQICCSLGHFLSGNVFSCSFFLLSHAVSWTINHIFSAWILREYGGMVPLSIPLR